MDDTSYSQGLLFQLPYRSEAEILGIIRPLHPFLWPVIMEPWEDLVDRRGHDRSFTDLTEEEMGIWLTMQAGKRAQAIFHGRNGIEVKLWYRKPVIIIPEVLAIMVKKLTKRRLQPGKTEELTRSNYMTERTKRLYNQQRDQHLPDLPRLTLGYELIREATDIRVLVAYPRTRSRGFEWAYRLRKPVVAHPEFPKLKVYAGDYKTAEPKGFGIGPGA